MNDSDRDRIVREYIRQAMDIQNGKDNEVPDLKGIARELGMTEEEIAEVERSAHEHCERGAGYCRHEQWDDAISELTIATALDPTNIEALGQLGAAYAGRWEEKKHKDDRTEAERLAKRCIELKPDHEPAFVLLERLSGHTPKGELVDAVASAQRTTRRVATIFASAVVVICGVVGAILFAGKSGSSSSGKSWAKGRPIPVSLSGPPGMTLQLDDARLYPGNGVCCVKADVTPAPSDSTVSAVQLELDVIDSSGNVAESDRFTARPCTTHVGSFYFHRDNPIVPKIKEMRIVAQ